MTKMINGGKVYYTLKDNLNNDLIKIIQQYNIRTIKNKKYIIMIIVIISCEKTN
jgi:DNA-binding CsgD family transcriptional regulator